MGRSGRKCAVGGSAGWYSCQFRKVPRYTKWWPLVPLPLPRLYVSVAQNENGNEHAHVSSIIVLAWFRRRAEGRPAQKVQRDATGFFVYHGGRLLARWGCPHTVYVVYLRPEIANERVKFVYKDVRNMGTIDELVSFILRSEEWMVRAR